MTKGKAMIDPERLGLSWEDVNEARSALAQVNPCINGDTDVALLWVLLQTLEEKASLYQRDANLIPFRFPCEPVAVRLLADGITEALDAYRGAIEITREELESSKKKALAVVDEIAARES
jgi:hypothetical protein